MRLAALLPKRYRALFARYRNRLLVLTLLFILYLAIDLAAGTFILVYLDPISFSRKHPLLVLGGFTLLFLLIKRFFGKRR